MDKSTLFIVAHMWIVGSYFQKEPPLLAGMGTIGLLFLLLSFFA